MCCIWEHSALATRSCTRASLALVASPLPRPHLLIVLFPSALSRSSLWTPSLPPTPPSHRARRSWKSWHSKRPQPRRRRCGGHGLWGGVFWGVGSARQQAQQAQLDTEEGPGGSGLAACRHYICPATLYGACSGATHSSRPVCQPHLQPHPSSPTPSPFTRRRSASAGSRRRRRPRPRRAVWTCRRRRRQRAPRTRLLAWATPLPTMMRSTVARDAESVPEGLRPRITFPGWPLRPLPSSSSCCRWGLFVWVVWGGVALLVLV